MAKRKQSKPAEPLAAMEARIISRLETVAERGRIEYWLPKIEAEAKRVLAKYSTEITRLDETGKPFVQKRRCEVKPYTLPEQFPPGTKRAEIKRAHDARAVMLDLTALAGQMQSGEMSWATGTAIHIGYALAILHVREWEQYFDGRNEGLSAARQENTRKANRRHEWVANQADEITKQHPGIKRPQLAKKIAKAMKEAKADEIRDTESVKTSFHKPLSADRIEEVLADRRPLRKRRRKQRQ